MLQKSVYSIFDTKTKLFSPPFYQRNHGEAIRSFSQVVNDTNSMVYKYPEDFTLQHIGEFDEETGLLSPATPSVLGTASQYLRSDHHAGM